MSGPYYKISHTNQKRPLLFSIILVTLAVVLINSDSVSTTGFVFMTLGYFFFITGMAKTKGKENV